MRPSSASLFDPRLASVLCFGPSSPSRVFVHHSSLLDLLDCPTPQSPPAAAASSTIRAISPSGSSSPRSAATERRERTLALTSCTPTRASASRSLGRIGGQTGTVRRSPPMGAAAEALHQIEQHRVALAVETGQPAALALDLLHQRLQLHLQRRAGDGPPRLAEGRARGLRQVVQRGAQLVDVARCADCTPLPASRSSRYALLPFRQLPLRARTDRDAVASRRRSPGPRSAPRRSRGCGPAR